MIITTGKMAYNRGCLWEIRAYVHSVAIIRGNLYEGVGFSDSSVCKEFPCNTGDPGLIAGSGRSPGEGIGYPRQYSWASLVAQLVKNLSAMRETWVQYLGWENPLEGSMTTLASMMTWRIPWTRSLVG